MILFEINKPWDSTPLGCQITTLPFFLLRKKLDIMLLNVGGIDEDIIRQEKRNDVHINFISIPHKGSIKQRTMDIDVAVGFASPSEAGPQRRILM